MKKILLGIYFFIIKASIFAQTQYDYYEDSDTYKRPEAIDGKTILGLIVLAIIVFVIWFLNACYKDWAKKHKKDRINKLLEPKPKTPLEIVKEELEEAKRKRGLEWERNIKAKQAEEAVKILYAEYQEDHILDGIIYRFNPNNWKKDAIDAFTQGYIWGSWRHYSYLTIDEIKRKHHPLIVLGYLRGLEEPEIWEKYGKFPG